MGTPRATECEPQVCRNQCVDADSRTRASRTFPSARNVRAIRKKYRFTCRYKPCGVSALCMSARPQAGMETTRGRSTWSRGSGDAPCAASVSPSSRTNAAGTGTQRCFIPFPMTWITQFTASRFTATVPAVERGVKTSPSITVPFAASISSASLVTTARSTHCAAQISASLKPVARKNRTTQSVCLARTSVDLALPSVSTTAHSARDKCRLVSTFGSDPRGIATPLQGLPFK